MSPGILSVCLALVGPPAAVLNDAGEPDGYNVAFGRELAARLGLTVDFQRPLFDQIAGHLTDHQCDVSISSQNVTPSREAQMNMLPYTRSQQPVLVEKGNPDHILALADMCGHPVSTTRGSTHEDLVQGRGDYAGQGLQSQCADAGDDPIDLLTFATEEEAVQALLDGDAIAYLGNPNFIYDYPDLLDYAQTALPAAEQGIATALDRPLLTHALAAAFQALIDDETYLTILRQYLPNEESVQVVSITE